MVQACNLATGKTEVGRVAAQGLSVLQDELKAT